MKMMTPVKTKMTKVNIADLEFVNYGDLVLLGGLAETFCTEAGLGLANNSVS